ncbi:MAG: flavodoxin [Lachnospiraceae bacterium]|nr:flavodoxin [Lachnospiraceae bacterium]
MEEYYVIYYSQTGNTKEMAEAVGAGITEAGKAAKVIEVAQARVDMIKDAESFALGCPAMGAENLEESEMDPFVTELESFAAGKKIVLFGSYGWGGGEWMRDWEKRMQDAGAQIVGGEGVICNETPDDDTLARCRELGKQMVQSE